MQKERKEMMRGGGKFVIGKSGRSDGRVCGGTGG